LPFGRGDVAVSEAVSSFDAVETPAAAAAAIPGEARTLPMPLEETYHVARERLLAEFERRYLTWLVQQAGSNISRAARIADVDRTTLYRLMERHGLQRTLTTNGGGGAGGGGGDGNLQEAKSI
jgi:transcriptional regulator of acetoin/glycerol metabolism